MTQVAPQENGHKTFINTGRTICSVPPMIKRIPFDGFLCGCGTHLVYEERVVFHHSIPYGKRIGRIIKSMKDCKVEGFLEANRGYLYYSNRICTGYWSRWKAGRRYGWSGTWGESSQWKIQVV
ncbi:MAG: HAD hydrolase family protein [Dorea sp.]